MPVALIVGIIRPHLQRIRTAIDRGDAAIRAGWVIEHVVTRHRNPEIGEAELTAALIAAAGHGGAHVIGISKQDGAVRKAIASAIRPYFRFRWLDNTLLGHLGSNAATFVENLNEILSEEEMWAAHVQPRTVTSPFLLPKSCFETARPLHNLWELGEHFGDPTMIPAAARTAERFEQQYWRLRPGVGFRWMDHSHRIFDHTGERHGVAPHPRGWKYSYAIPGGFHYDVTTAHGRAFTLFDDLGSSRAAVDGAHLNVDPHGFIR